MTVNRVCGSGAQAIASAAQEIMLGMVDNAVAGGMENMDQAPYLMSGGRWGYRVGDAEIYAPSWAQRSSGARSKRRSSLIQKSTLSSWAMWFKPGIR